MKLWKKIVKSLRMVELIYGCPYDESPDFYIENAPFYLASIIALILVGSALIYIALR